MELFESITLISIQTASYLPSYLYYVEWVAHTTTISQDSVGRPGYGE